MNRRLTARGRERRRQLMDYAARRFAENGYHPTSVAEIVAGMEVGKGVFYWYFDSKETLLIEILAEAQRDLRRSQMAAIAAEADPLRRIEVGIRRTLEWMADNRHLFSLFEFAASDERFAPSLRRGQEVAVGDVVRHVKQAMVGAGANAEADPLVVSYAILGVTNALARTFLFERGDPPQTVADAAISFCLGGILGKAA
ncbi:MAG TPA: TetR/AcrR family transcriptional regulator [Acidimicrobiales bacterium]|nr:TetR/AcrR family transcriptional regulator [Acidimicrobiales bacterium]